MENRDEYWNWTKLRGLAIYAKVYPLRNTSQRFRISQIFCNTTALQRWELLDAYQVQQQLLHGIHLGEIKMLMFCTSNKAILDFLLCLLQHFLSHVYWQYVNTLRHTTVMHFCRKLLFYYCNTILLKCTACYLTICFITNNIHNSVIGTVLLVTKGNWWQKVNIIACHDEGEFGEFWKREWKQIRLDVEKGQENWSK